MKNSRFAKVLVLGIALLMVLCSMAPISGAAASKVTISMPDFVDPATASGDAKWVLARENAFDAANPTITVKHISITQPTPDKFMEFWSTQMATAEGPSALNVSAIQYARQLAGTGFLASWNDYLKNTDFKKMYPSLQKYSTVGKNVIAIPSTVEIAGLGLNKALLTQAGYKADYAPKTWADFTKMAQKMTKGDVAGFPILATEFYLWFNNWNLANGGDLAAGNPDGTIRLTFTNPNNIETLKYFLDLANKYKVAQTNIHADVMGVIGSLWTKKAGAFTFYPSWAAWFSSQGLKPDEISLVPFPKGPHGKGATGIYPTCWVMNAKKSKDELAATAKYINYVYVGKDAFKSRLSYIRDNGIAAVMMTPYADIDWAKYCTTVPASWSKTAKAIIAKASVPTTTNTQYTDYFLKAIVEAFDNPTGDLQAIVAKYQKVCEDEWLKPYNDKIKAGK